MAMIYLKVWSWWRRVKPAVQHRKAQEQAEREWARGHEHEHERAQQQQKEQQQQRQRRVSPRRKDEQK